MISLESLSLPQFTYLLAHLSRPMSPTEARSLALILDQNDTEMLLKALVAISNLAAFTSNQVGFCK